MSFANQPTVLAGLGLAPRKPRTPLTAEQLAARVAKAKATREARGTKGSKQKAAIVGNVTGVSISPLTAPAAVPATTAAAPKA